MITLEDHDLIAFAGDWHGNTFWAKYYLDACARTGVKHIFHTGDFDLSLSKNFLRGLRYKLEEHDQHLYFVDGNHDDHPKLRKWRLDDDGFGIFPFESTGSDRIHYIPRGTRFKVWDKIFMGLGGAHSVDRNKRTLGWDWWPEEVISISDMYRAMDGGKVDVMITHDNPECSRPPTARKYSGSWPAIEYEISEQNRKTLQAVVDETQPSLLVHGHHHVFYEQQIGQLRVVGLHRDGASTDQNIYVVDSDLERRSVAIDRTDEGDTDGDTD